MELKAMNVEQLRDSLYWTLKPRDENRGQAVFDELASRLSARDQRIAELQEQVQSLEIDVVDCNQLRAESEYALDQALRENAALVDSTDKIHTELVKRGIELAVSRQQMAGLVEALRPFAHEDLCKTVGGQERPDSCVFGRDKAILKLSDFNRAREVIANLPESARKVGAVIEKANIWSDKRGDCEAVGFNSLEESELYVAIRALRST